MTSKFAAVIGRPIAQSLSPVIHRAGFASTGADWTYSAIDAGSEDLPAIIQRLREGAMHGVSVTMPLKSDVCSYLDRLDPAVHVLSSANTVSVADDGTLCGHSTDGDGLCDSIDEAGLSIVGRDFLILGAGGAARSIAEALVRRGSRRVAISNRTIDRANDLVARIDGTIVADALEIEVPRADVIVNATKVGMGTSEVPFDTAMLRSRTAVVDIVYHPIDTELLKQARAVGCPTIDGLRMLIHQAARQQFIWTGASPDVMAMTEAARRALESRPVT